MNTMEFAWTYLGVSVVGLLIVLPTHLYLICMGLNTQRIFRSLGQTKGYCGEILICVCYGTYMFHLIFWFFVQPTLLLRINSDESFECTDIQSKLIAVVELLYHASYPLSWQILFISAVWQLLNIKKRHQQ